MAIKEIKYITISRDMILKLIKGNLFFSIHVSSDFGSEKICWSINIIIDAQKFSAIHSLYQTSWHGSDWVGVKISNNSSECREIWIQARASDTKWA